MKNVTLASVLILLVISSTLIPESEAEHPLVLRLRKVPAVAPEDRPAHKRIRLGTLLRKPKDHRRHRHHHSRHIHPSPHYGSEGKAIVPVVNFSSMDGILLNLLMRHLS